MDEQSVIAILKELLTLEQAAPAPRLFESTVFVSQLSVANWRITKRIADTNKKNCAMLVELIQGLGGTPGPRIRDVATADLHFQELRSVLPRLIAEQEALTAKYQTANRHVASHAKAASLIHQILKQHQDALIELRSLQENTVDVAS